MLNRGQLLNLLEISAAVAITAAGFALTGPVATAVMTSIGLNLTGGIIRRGVVGLKEGWLSSKNGILNHDIQQALVRAFIKALTHLEDRYFGLSEANALPKSEKESIKAFFKELKKQAQKVFLASLEKAVKEKEVKDYLYRSEETAKANLWDRINGANLLATYNEHFRDFLRKNLLTAVQFWFGEELKTDSKECNKAWRAFQRLLLEGIQADVKAVQANQDLIRQDLQTLEVLKGQLDQIRDTIDHRLTNEPFQQGLEKAVNEMQAVLQDVAKTTKRTEKKVDAIAADVKTLLGIKAELPPPQLDEEIKLLSDELKKIIDDKHLTVKVDRIDDGIVRIENDLKKLTDNNANTLEVPANSFQKSENLFKQHEMPLSKHQIGIIIDVPVLQGREQVLSLLNIFWHEDNKKIAIIAGLGGVGKTAIVTQFAKNLLEDYPVVWINSSIVVGLETIIHNLATLAAVNGLDLSDEFQDENKETPQVKIGQCLVALQNWKCLVVIDDLHLMNETFSKDLLSVFEKYSIKVKIIAITRRWNNWFYSLRPDTLLAINPLPGLDIDAFLLLLEYHKINCSADIGKKLWLKTGKGNPKATEIFVGILGSHKNILSLLEILPDFEEALADQWVQSLFVELTENEKELACILSVFQESISVSDLERLVGKSSSEFNQVLKGLKERFFVSGGSDNLKIHDLLKMYCYQKIERPEEIHFKVAQLYMDKASAELSSSKYFEDTLNRRTAEYYIQGHLHLLKAQRWEDAIDVLKKAKSILINTGQSAIFIDILSNSSANSDCFEKDHWLVFAKAQALYHLGREKEAVSIISEIEKIPNKNLHAECLHFRLNMLLDNKKYEKAKIFLTNYLPILMQSTSRRNSTRILLKAADIFIETKDYTEAEKILEQLWNSKDAYGDEYSLGLIEQKSGKLYCLTKRALLGFELFEKSVGRFEKIGAINAASRCLKEKGDIEETMGFIEQSQKTYNELLCIYLKSDNFIGYNKITKKILNL